jgi:uncharacterized protein YbjT (DUF2867 family)
MTRYAVVGASKGTGREIVRHLAEQKIPVRAIARRSQPAEDGVEPFVADVTDAASIAEALEGGFDAVFYTVDIHGLNSRAAVRRVMYDGCVNAIHAARAAGARRFLLLSVIGADRPSWLWWILNAIKPGMRSNILDREQALKDSGLDYVICRAPKLRDGKGGLVPLSATPPVNRLGLRMGIPRAALASAMVRAAEAAPDHSVWDVFADPARAASGWLLPAAQIAMRPSSD